MKAKPNKEKKNEQNRTEKRGKKSTKYYGNYESTSTDLIETVKQYDENKNGTNRK